MQAKSISMATTILYIQNSNFNVISKRHPKGSIKNTKLFTGLVSDELTGGYDVVKGERIKIHGYLEDFALSKDEADGLIMSARKIVYKD